MYGLVSSWLAEMQGDGRKGVGITYAGTGGGTQNNPQSARPGVEGLLLGMVDLAGRSWMEGLSTAASYNNLQGIRIQRNSDTQQEGGRVVDNSLAVRGCRGSDVCFPLSANYM